MDSTKRTRIKTQLDNAQARYEAVQEAYIALVEGGVKSYMIEDRQLTKLDLPALRSELNELEKKISEYEAVYNGKAARKAVGVVPRDW